jgi:hypothetical protein
VRVGGAASAASAMDAATPVEGGGCDKGGAEVGGLGGGEEVVVAGEDDMTERGQSDTKLVGTACLPGLGRRL